MIHEHWTDDFPQEAAYDRMVRRHAKAQAHEDRDTGTTLDPLPSFDDWANPSHEEDDDDNA